MSTDRKRLVVVGNGPLTRDFSPEVDAADFVVRFNEPKQGIGLSGTRTDRLVMSNAGKPAQRRLGDPALLTSPIFTAAREIVFAYHPQIIRRYFRHPNILSRLKGRRADWTLPALEKFGAAGKKIVVMPPQFYLDGCRDLGVPEERMHEVFPSTGYFGIWQALKEFPEDAWLIEIHGFTWEGWQRHAWADERRWIDRLVDMGRVTVIGAP